MYVFGIEIPLVEIILAMGIIGLIILFEIAAVLLLITYLMKRSKKLEDRIGLLVDSLVSLNKEELKELKEIYELSGKVNLKKDKKESINKVSQRKYSKMNFFTFARFFKKAPKLEEIKSKPKEEMILSESKVQGMLSKVFGDGKSKKRVTVKEKRKLYATFVKKGKNNKFLKKIKKFVKKFRK